MATAFTHPLARQAQIWTTEGISSKASRILVVITTLELDPKSKSHKPDKLKRLSDAAREWVSANPKDASDVLVISRPREWAGDRDPAPSAR